MVKGSTFIAVRRMEFQEFSHLDRAIEWAGAEGRVYEITHHVHRSSSGEVELLPRSRRVYG